MLPIVANCSYLMPVGTPPNASVYGSGLVTLPQMARAGLLLNVALVPIVLALLLLLGPYVFGLEAAVVPDWPRAGDARLMTGSQALAVPPSVSRDR